MLDSQEIIYERRNKAERLLSYAAIIFGIALLNPGMDIFQMVPAHLMMSQLGTRFLWGAIVVIVGLAQRIAVETRGPMARLIAAAIACFSWITLGIFFWLGEWISPTPPNPFWALFTLRVGLALLFGAFQAELCAALFRKNFLNHRPDG